MSSRHYRSMHATLDFNRRDFLKAGALGAGLVLGTPTAWAEQAAQSTRPARPRTNVDEALKVPRTKHSLPGLCPGKVVHVQDEKALAGDRPVAEVIERMFAGGLKKLTGQDLAESFRLFFTKDDVVGIKVNPVGGGLISTRTELVEAIIKWLTAQGLPRKNIIIWDRFDFMLAEAGFTPERFPEVRIVGLQTMQTDEAAAARPEGATWRDAQGQHVSAPNFDKDVFYWADVEGPSDLANLNQEVFAGQHSYFGRLVTQTVTKLINVPVFKNTGQGVSMATKNLGYGAICNTSRLHQPLFFDVCTEVLAFPCIRDKLVLNITDGLRGQYDGGPMPAAQFVYDYNSLFLATDPFALDSVGHNLLLEKRKSKGLKINEHPMFTDYLRYAERLGLGVVDPAKVRVERV